MVAVTLIFAILQVSKMPLLILDEAEAALDEANVERYAKYCLELNKLTQVLLVTHRPGTMENCDLLYGVTMEKKGVTKLVSIKLEQAKEMVE
jgi:chromosome segregation protein